MARDEISTLNRTTKVNTAVQVQDFQKAMNDFATSSNAMGQMGSKMAQTASNSFSEHMGYESGKDPHGDILPPLTESDKHFAAAYKSQSQATLGMQLTSMTTDGQVELSKAEQLTPDLIKTYNQNMQLGANKILELAPSGVKETLENNFGRHMLQTNGQLTTRMLSEQKKNNYSQQVAYNNDQTIALYNSARAVQGQNLDSSIDMLQDILDINKHNLENHVFTQTQHDGNVQQAKMSYFKGKYNGELDAAKDANTGDAYLSNFSKNKPQELNFLEWEQVQKSLISNIKLSDTLRNQERQSFLIDLKTKIDTHTLTQNDLTKASQVLSATQQNKIVSSFNIQQFKLDEKKEKINEVISHWAALDTHLNNSQADLTIGFNQQVANAKESNPGLSQPQIETAVINSSPMEVKSYTAKINGQLLSGDGAAMLQAGESWENINRNHPNNIPITKDALASLVVFRDRLEAGADPDLAAQETAQIIKRKTTDDIEFINSLAKSFSKTNLQTNAQAMSFALDIADVKQSQIPAPFEFAKIVQREFNENVKLTGSIESAKKLTKIQVGKTYGLSEVNGKEQFLRLPIEKTIGIPNSASSTAIINADLAEQFDQQVAENNIMFDKGQSNFSFKVTKRPDIKAAMKAASELRDIDDKKLNDGEYWSELRKHMKVLNEFGKSGQVEALQTFKDGHTVTHTLSVRAGMFVTQSSNPDNNIIGGYDITGTSENGATQPLVGASTASINGLFYHPNKNSIGATYFALNPVPESDGLTLQEKLNQFKERRSFLDRIGSEVKEGLAGLAAIKLRNKG